MPTILLNKIRIGGKAPTNIKKGSADVKYVKKGNTVIYDTLNYYSYGTPSLTLTYPSGNVSASGGSKTPSTRSWTQTRTAYGHSGATYSATSLSGTITNFSVSPSGYGTLNSSTGVYTFSAISQAISRTVTITGTVTSNSKTGTTTATLKQDPPSYYTATIYWENWIECGQVDWGCFNGQPTQNNSNAKYDMETGSDYSTFFFSPGDYLHVNGTAAGTVANIANGGTVVCYFWDDNNVRWRLIGSFTHDSSKSYTRNIRYNGSYY